MKSVLIIIGILLVGLLLWEHTTAQEIQDNRWSLPYRLSADGVDASDAFMLSDQYGFVHVFWRESGFAHNRQVIQYARFDGQGWTGPLDIYATAPGKVVNHMSPTLDQNGRLHLAWVEGNSGPVLYSSAFIFDAMSARSWSNPVRLNIPAFRVQLGVDSANVLHMVYADFYAEDRPGVFYLRSEDEGQSWTDPLWLDSDIPPGHTVGWVQFQIDEQDSLHIVWTYFNKKEAINKMVRYINSLDAGQSWSSPFFIDIADEAPDELRMANPGIIVQGENVHVIYAGDYQTRREHRLSTDRGQTWQNIVPIFGELHGQAIGDGLALDTEGHLHFVGQIRYPQGIWHAYWDENQWQDLKLAYWFDPTINYISAHNTRLAIRTGNQLVMTFTDAPADSEMRLFAMVRTLDDVPALSKMPRPELTPTPALQPEQTAIVAPEMPTPTRMPLSTNTLSAIPDNAANPGNSIWMGLVPPVILVALIFGLQLFKRS